MSAKDLKVVLPVDEAPADRKSASSLSSDQSEASINLLDSRNRNLFLTKVGIAFMLYSLACFCTSIFILIDIKRTTIVYRQWSLQTVLWVFFSISVLIKLVFGFFGAPIRKLAKLAFPIDVFATVMFVLGLYYFLDAAKTTTNYTYAPFVVVVCVNFFASSFFFTLSTLYHSRSKAYNYLLGTALMTVFNVVAIVGLAFGWKQVVTITPWQYAWVGVAFLFLNLYVCVNSYYIVNVRVDKYTESDAAWAFYSYWTDWVFAFWKNVFENTARIIRQKHRQMRKNQKNRPTDHGKKNKKAPQKSDGKSGEASKPKDPVPQAEATKSKPPAEAPKAVENKQAIENVEVKIA